MHLPKESPEAGIVRTFVEAFDRSDREGIVACLAEDLESHITQADASTKRLDGRAAFMSGIDALDIPTVRPSATITQIATVAPGQVMVMIEIRAERKGRSLRNFAAYLAHVENDRITRLFMVEALPAESDRFWNS